MISSSNHELSNCNQMFTQVGMTLHKSRKDVYLISHPHNMKTMYGSSRSFWLEKDSLPASQVDMMARMLPMTIVRNSEVFLPKHPLIKGQVYIRLSVICRKR